MANNDIAIDTEKKAIHFSGKTYTRWENIRWLRSQLQLMELNAEILWGSEAQAAALAVQKRQEAELKERGFIVIEGGKEK